MTRKQAVSTLRIAAERAPELLPPAVAHFAGLEEPLPAPQRAVIRAAVGELLAQLRRDLDLADIALQAADPEFAVSRLADLARSLPPALDRLDGQLAGLLPDLRP